jgi:ATP-dependent Clp protease ATP-binding subunit ClpA
MWKFFTESARRAILRAQTMAMENGDTEVAPIHLLLGILSETDEYSTNVGYLLALAGLTSEELRLYCYAAAPKQAGPSYEPKLSPEAKRVLDLTANTVRRLNSPCVDLEHLLVGLARLKQGPHYEAVLRPLGLDEKVLLRHIRAMNRPAKWCRHPVESASFASRGILDLAENHMRATFCGRIGTGHLLLALLENPSGMMASLLQAASVNEVELRAALRRRIVQDGEIATPQRRYDRAAQGVLDRARDLALSEGFRQWGPVHLLLALLPRRLTLQAAGRGEFEHAAEHALEPFAEALRAGYARSLARPSPTLSAGVQDAMLREAVIHLALIGAGPVQWWLGYFTITERIPGFGFFGMMLLLTIPVAAMAAVGSVVKPRYVQARSHGLSYLSGLVIVGLLILNQFLT